MTHENSGWLRVIIMLLAAEKIVQHVAVTLALYLNWRDIRSTVAVPPDVLLVLGAIAAVLWAVALWGLARRRRWAAGLVMGLAVFDMVGEFAAQGRLDIQINVSFLVATSLLILCLVYRGRTARAASLAVGGK